MWYYVRGLSEASLDKMAVRDAEYGIFIPKSDQEKAFLKAAQRRLAAGTGGCTSVNTPGQINNCAAANTPFVQDFT